MSIEDLQFQLEQKRIWDDELAILCNKYKLGRYSKPAFKRNKKRLERKLASIDAEIDKLKGKQK